MLVGRYCSDFPVKGGCSDIPPQTRMCVCVGGGCVFSYCLLNAELRANTHQRTAVPPGTGEFPVSH